MKNDGADAMSSEDAFAAYGIEAADIESGAVLGRSPAMRDVFRYVQRYARSDLNVMIRGESGAGKEVVARLLHLYSDRAGRPFVALNCAALSETMLESELFGHERGAFTGAVRCHRGRFERAADGMLFLDEIGDISPSFQAKLLRVLQEGEFERVGGTERIRTGARVIAATNSDLEDAVRRGRFRLDLYFRLNVATVYVPPLRERPDDIRLLAHRIVLKRSALRERIKGLSPAALDRLAACRWPGNVRELENCILRAASAEESSIIDADSLCCARGRCFSQHFWADEASRFPQHAGTAPAPDGDAQPASLWIQHANGRRFIGKVSRERLLDALRRSGWIQSRAARMLGLTARQVSYAIRRYEIAAPRL
jgi:Nif-specific regulatory protein